MKIYQVEELVGITKKNIRFYEDEGLLNPDRNPENGYREYSLEDVHQLEKIKLLRMLGVSIEEIRKLLKNNADFRGTMEQRISNLEQEQSNAEHMKNRCEKLKEEVENLTTLDASKYLDEIKNIETKGTSFVDIEKEDIKRKKISGAVIVASGFCLIMTLIMVLMIIYLIKKAKALAPLLIIIGCMLCFIVGVVVVLTQRIKEINGGEEYDARKY